MNTIMNGWFSEICPMWPGMALSVEIEELIYSKKSKFQQIDLYMTKTYGKMLVLDNIIQLTERDEFAYHEMMTHVPLFAHPNPERVLVVGGGDGGILREVARHDCVGQIDWCEIDPAVIEVARRFLPTMAKGFDDPRVRLHMEDGKKFVDDHKQSYDVIIVDSSDPIGPGKALFELPFYKALKASLKQGGIVATQGESFFIHTECVNNLTTITRQLFPVQAYSYMLVPSYPGGHLGICLASLGPEVKKPARPISTGMQQTLDYYSPEIHQASFVLPHFMTKGSNPDISPFPAKGEPCGQGSSVEVKIVQSANPLEIMALYRDAGWWKKEYDSDTSFLDTLVAGSTCFAAAFDRGTMVGMGRALSDGVSDAYIQDMVILRQYRKQGIGRRIIQALIHCLTEKKIDWIGLIATPGNQGFYAGMGFKPMEGHTPFVFKGAPEQIDHGSEE
ncbi:MAG: spermidine synthase [Desulfobacterium sp.]|nr:spermidine synthase [Desulfobacterium sp.]